MIEFSKDAQYYHQQASIAADQGRWADALFYYRDSLALSFDADVSLDYAYYLKSLRQYDMALLVALPLTTYDLDPDQKQEWCDFMAELCHEKLDFAGYIHYMRLSAALEGKDDSIFDKESLRKTFLEQEEEQALQFSDDAHEAENLNLLRAMLAAYEGGDYTLTEALFARMNPQHEYYPAALYVMAKTLSVVGRTEEAEGYLWPAYEAQGNDPRVIYNLHAALSLTPQRIQEALNKVDTTSASACGIAAILACHYGLHEDALRYASLSYEAEPANHTYGIRLYVALNNLGRYAEAGEHLRRVVNLYRCFYPVSILRLNIRKPMSLDFAFLPEPMQKRLLSKLKAQTEKDGFCTSLLTDSTFREGVLFLLSVPFNSKRDPQWLLDQLSTCDAPEVVELICQLLVRPNLPAEVRHRLILQLLQRGVHGKISVAIKHFVRAISLKVPPSFDDYSDRLQEAYAYACCDCLYGSQTKTVRIARVAERLYLHGIPANCNTEMLGYAMVASQPNYDQARLQEILRIRGWTPRQFQRHLKLVQASLSQED